MRARSQVKRGKRVKAILERVKGMRGRKKTCIKLAKQHSLKRIEAQCEGRILRKRNSRSLWIQRINSAARKYFHISYSVFMNLYKKSNGELNRKSLSEIAIRNPETFFNYCQNIIQV